MSNLVKSENQFVKPHFIEQLGCEGLTAADIAKSLGITASTVRQKLSTKGYFDLLIAQRFQAVTFTTANDINGLEFEEYALDIMASKFFVAKYNNDIGSAYLTYLIRLEQKVDALDIEAENDPTLASILKIAQLRRHQIEAEKHLSILDQKTDRFESALLDMQLNSPQRDQLKQMIDTKAEQLGDIRYVGKIQRDIKVRFDMNTTNSKWYHLAQRHYDDAVALVRKWRV